MVATAATMLFDYFDDSQRLGGHMEQSSRMIAGGRMCYELDGTQGFACGARI